MSFLLLIVSLLLLIALLILWMKWKKEKINASALSQKLEETKEELNKERHQTREARLVKEKYVRYFLNLCSMHVEKFSEYQQMANEKIKSGEIDDLYRLNCSTYFV